MATDKHNPNKLGYVPPDNSMLISRKRKAECFDCGGKGWVWEGDEKVECFECNGKGWFWKEE